VPETETEIIVAEAVNSGLFKLAGEIYEIKLEAVTTDEQLVPITELATVIKMHLPVPEDMQELASAGLLTGAWYNDESKKWEELPSTCLGRGCFEETLG